MTDRRAVGSPLAQRRVAAADAGFTLVEMIVALTIIALVFTSLTYVMTGAIGAYGSARQRSAAVEVANEAIETLRSLPYDQVGVKGNDPDLGPMYPGSPPSRNGFPAVIVPNTSVAPPAVQAVSESGPLAVRGLGPYTIRRWVTWDDPASAPGAGGQRHKRLEIQIQWTEQGKIDKSFSINSVLYPGELGSILGPNGSPTVSLSATPANVSLGSTVRFAAAATDPEGDPITYEWTFGDTTPTAIAGSTFDHVYGQPGFYTATVVVRDNRGGSASSSQPIAVSGGCAGGPTFGTPALTASPDNGDGPLDVLFTGAATSPSSSNLQYFWNFGDGTSATSSSASGQSAVGKQYANVRADTTYTVTLRVADTCNNSVTTSMPVIVRPGGCVVTEGVFRQQSNTLDNNIIVDANGRALSGQLQFTFNVRTTDACNTVSAQLPLAGGGTFSVDLNRIGGAPSGQQDWRGSDSIGQNTRFDLTPGATRTWDIFSPRRSTGGATPQLSPAFTMTAIG